MKDNAWGAVCVKLLQGPIYRTGANDSTWNSLTSWIKDINEYFSRLNLKVTVNDNDGYAYLEQIEDAEDTNKIPRLIKKVPLTIELSLLCVLLREALDDFDVSESEDAFLVMKESEIKDMMMPYMKNIPDQTKIYRKLDEYLNQLVRLSFIREITDIKSENNNQQRDREYEIRRIIKAKIGPSFLAEFKKRLNNILDNTESGYEEVMKEEVSEDD
ncbi:MAG: DUF4194 domain-containing protein [Treponema sp.]|nr:DUF4194 domain-containing protein [Treponema sp.]